MRDDTRRLLASFVPGIPFAYKYVVVSAILKANRANIDGICAVVGLSVTAKIIIVISMLKSIENFNPTGPGEEPKKKRMHSNEQ